MWKKENLLVVRQIHPKNKHPYILVVDKPSFSVHLLIGPRKIHVNGPIENLSENDIQILKSLRTSDSIKNYITYPLTNFI